MNFLKELPFHQDQHAEQLLPGCHHQGKSPSPVYSTDKLISCVALIPSLPSYLFRLSVFTNSSPLLCSFLGLVGNNMVVVVLCCHTGPKTVANIYIFNLAMADLLSLATFPFWATYYTQGYNWVFGSFMWKISSSVLCLNMFASIFFIMCMSMDWYHAIVHPIHSQRRTPQAYFLALVVWGLTCLSSLPTFYFRDTYYVESLEVNACIMAFPYEHYAKWSVAIIFLKNTLGFFIPLAVITTCYIWIRRHLLKAQELGKSRQKRDKVLKLVAAVVMAFLISWLPFHVLTFLNALAHVDIINNCEVMVVIDTALSFGICMAFTNSCIKSLLYCFIGNQFQEKLHCLFKRRVYQFNSHRESSSARKGSFFRDAKTPMSKEGEPESFLQALGHDVG